MLSCWGDQPSAGSTPLAIQRKIAELERAFLAPWEPGSTVAVGRSYGRRALPFVGSLLFGTCNTHSGNFAPQK